MSAHGWPDVACDLWVIRQWQAKQALQDGNSTACDLVLMDELGDEQAGYGLPDDYTCGPRLHVFGSDDCEVWLGCMSAAWISPGDLCGLVTLMISDSGMAAAIAQDGAYVVVLDGRDVTGWYHSEVHHGATAAD